MIEVGQHPVRRFGPTAWVVLQELSDRGVAADGGVVACASIRDLALQLGLSKNTVQRALGRLTRGRAHRSASASHHRRHVLVRPLRDLRETRPT